MIDKIKINLLGRKPMIRSLPRKVQDFIVSNAIAPL